MAIGKHRKPRMMEHPERVIERRRAASERRIMANFYKKCPQCNGTLESVKALIYADAAGELENYRGDLMGFESTAQITTGINAGNLAAVEYFCRFCDVTGMLVYDPEENRTRFFLKYSALAVGQK